MPDETFPPDPIIRKKAIIADLGVDKSTLSDWIARGDFPEPLVLNPGQKREIIGWPTSVYQSWKANLPQRAAKPITQAAYTDEARAKGQRTRAAKRAGSAPEPTPPAPHRVKRPRGVSR